MRHVWGNLSKVSVMCHSIWNWTTTFTKPINPIESFAFPDASKTYVRYDYRRFYWRALCAWNRPKIWTTGITLYLTVDNTSEMTKNPARKFARLPRGKYTARFYFKNVRTDSIYTRGGHWCIKTESMHVPATQKKCSNGWYACCNRKFRKPDEAEAPVSMLVCSLDIPMSTSHCALQLYCHTTATYIYWTLQNNNVPTW